MLCIYYIYNKPLNIPRSIQRPHFRVTAWLSEMVDDRSVYITSVNTYDTLYISRKLEAVLMKKS